MKYSGKRFVVHLQFAFTDQPLEHGRLPIQNTANIKLPDASANIRKPQAEQG
jgi:hypothetical protein